MIKNFLSGIVLIGAGIAGTLYYQSLQPPKIEIVEKTKIVTKYIDRDYSAMPRQDLMDELLKYDKGPFLLDGKMISDDTIHITAELHERKAERDFRFKVGQSSNFRYYVGAGIVGLVSGGYTVYKLKKYIDKISD